ncbi:MAG: hypothetical protein FJW40_09420 [Acidobacteria bacterium]|nr:hypothetical protein [Acidobacteriota bacterium]
MLVTAYDAHVEQLFDRVRQLHAILTAHGIPYRIVGGVAVYLHVSAVDPLSARMTKDVDAAIHRRDLDRVIAAAAEAGWTYRHAAGVDMLIGQPESKARSAVHLIFLNERVRPDHLEPVPASAPVATPEGFLLAPLPDLIRMKLTSFRLKDQVHIQDLDAAGLITPPIEAALPPLLRQRLAQVRTTE